MTTEQPIGRDDRDEGDDIDAAISMEERQQRIDEQQEELGLSPDVPGPSGGDETLPPEA